MGQKNTPEQPQTKETSKNTPPTGEKKVVKKKMNVVAEIKQLSKPADFFGEMGSALDKYFK